MCFWFVAAAAVVVDIFCYLDNCRISLISLCEKVLNEKEEVPDLHLNHLI